MVKRGSRNRSCGPGEEFLPYSHTELNEELVEYARTYLNETEETRKKALEEIKEFLKRDIKLHAEVPDILCLCFLRSRKFDVGRTCALMKKGADFVGSHRYIFDRMDSDAVRRTVQSRVVGFLPYRDTKGRAIVFAQAACWNPSELKADDLIFGSIVSLHAAGENPVNQVAGFVIVVDFKDLSIEQVVAMSRWLIFGLQALQNCCPCLVKEIHIVHTPAVFRATWKIAKPFISEKLTKRVTFYKSSRWDALHRRIDPRILPKELGGQLGPYSHEHWARDIADIEKKYHQNCAMYWNNLE